MKEIVTRLHETRQVELAKEILESAGYKVTKKKSKVTKKSKRLKESFSWNSYEDYPGSTTYYVEEYEDPENEEYDGPYIVYDEDEGGSFYAFLGQNDSRGMEFEDLESAKKYIEDNWNS